MQDVKDNDRIGAKGVSLLRILVASYFIAVALGVIPGANFSQLTGLIAEPQVAKVLAAIVVFSLSYMVMIGYRTRASALILAIFTFFAAFVTYTSSGDLGAFWRDIALVAALMLTYPERQMPDESALSRLSRRFAKVGSGGALRRDARPEQPAALNETPQDETPKFAAPVTRLETSRCLNSTTRPTDLRAPLATDEIENIFDDYAEAR